MCLGVFQKARVVVAEAVSVHFRDRRFGGYDAVEQRLGNRGLVADIEGKQDLLGDCGIEHDRGRFGVEPEVELGCFGGIAGRVNVAAHDDDLLDARSQVRAADQNLGEVGEGSDGDDSEIAVGLFDGGQQAFHGGLHAAFKRWPGHGEGTGEFERAFALRHLHRVDQRVLRTQAHGDCLVEQRERGADIVDTFFRPDVA